MCKVYTKYGRPSYIRLCYRFGNDQGKHIELAGRDPKSLIRSGHYYDPQPDYRKPASEQKLKQVNRYRSKHPRCVHGRLVGRMRDGHPHNHYCWKCGGY